MSLLRDYLHPGRGERSGYLILALLIILLLLYRFWLADLFLGPSEQEIRDMQKALVRFEHSTQAAPPPVSIGLIASFDPNTASADTLKMAGLPEFLAERIVRFRAAGGFFNQPSDLKRIYGVSDSLFQKISPAIQIEPRYIRGEKKSKEQQPAYTNTWHTPNRGPRYHNINLNTSDSADWEQLPGIGPALASRIIRFRERLGGFHSTKQLKEVYGIPEETLQQIYPYLITADDKLKKIDINAATEEEIRRHPYLDYKRARLIIRYREQHGKYRTLQDLKNIPLFHDTLLERMEPYFEAR